MRSRLFFAPRRSPRRGPIRTTVACSTAPQHSVVQRAVAYGGDMGSSPERHLDGPLAAERCGAGPTVAFLHPLPHDRSAWLYQTAHFAAWFHTVAIDFPGLGASPHASEGLTIEELAEACWHELEADGPIVLIGLSIGSRVAQYMAAGRPDRVRALVLTGGWSPPDDVRFQGSIARHIDRYRTEGLAARRAHIERNYGPRFAATELAQHFTQLWCERNDRADAASIIALLRALQTPVPDDLHARISAPTLVVTGTADAGHASHLRLAERIGGAQVRAIEGAGHVCNLERPWEYDAHVIAFLRALALLPR